VSNEKAADEWLSGEELVTLIRGQLKCSIGRAQAIIERARASGEVRFRKWPVPVLLTADDGIVGMEMRPGALKKGWVTADGIIGLELRPGAENWRREPLTTEETSKADFLDWFDRHYPAAAAPVDTARRAALDVAKPPTPPKNPGGHPTDKKRIVDEARRRLKKKKKILGTLTAFAQSLREWLEEQDDPKPYRAKKTGEVMARETIEGHVRELWNSYSHE
jgi:hypothetical protein